MVVAGASAGAGVVTGVIAGPEVGTPGAPAPDDVSVAWATAGEVASPTRVAVAVAVACACGGWLSVACQSQPTSISASAIAAGTTNRDRKPAQLAMSCRIYPTAKPK